MLRTNLFVLTARSNNSGLSQQQNIVVLCLPRNLQPSLIYLKWVVRSGFSQNWHYNAVTPFSLICRLPRKMVNFWLHFLYLGWRSVKNDILRSRTPIALGVLLLVDSIWSQQNTFTPITPRPSGANPSWPRQHRSDVSKPRNTTEPLLAMRGTTSHDKSFSQNSTRPHIYIHLHSHLSDTPRHHEHPHAGRFSQNWHYIAVTPFSLICRLPRKMVNFTCGHKLPFWFCLFVYITTQTWLK